MRRTIGVFNGVGLVRPLPVGIYILRGPSLSHRGISSTSIHTSFKPTIHPNTNHSSLLITNPNTNFTMSPSSTVYPSHSSTINGTFDNASYDHSTSDSDSSSFTLSSYARTMHQHTKLQMEAASRSARRCSSEQDASNAHGNMRPVAGESIGSMDSQRS